MSNEYRIYEIRRKYQGGWKVRFEETTRMDGGYDLKKQPGWMEGTI